MGYWDLSPPMLAAKEGLGSSFPNVLNVAVLSWETEHPGVRRCWALGTGTGKEPQQCSVCDLTFPNAAAHAWYFGLLTPGQPWLLLVDQHPWCLWVDLCKPIGFCAHLCPPNSPWKLSCEQAVLCRGSALHVYIFKPIISLFLRLWDNNLNTGYTVVVIQSKEHSLGISYA